MKAYDVLPLHWYKVQTEHGPVTLKITKIVDPGWWAESVNGVRFKIHEPEQIIEEVPAPNAPKPKRKLLKRQTNKVSQVKGQTTMGLID